MATKRAWKAPDPALVAQGEAQAVEKMAVFLQQFDYLLPEAKVGSNDVKAALREFQKESKIPQTGEFDRTTAAEMEKPRCSFSNRRVGDGTPRWSQTTLKYKFANFSSHMSEQSIKSCLRNAFNQWSNFSGLTFIEEKSGSANINIGWYYGDHGDRNSFDGAGNVLAHAFLPPDGRLHFDEAEGWDESLLTGVALHEIGHVLGLFHTTDSGAVMYPTYSGRQSLAMDDKTRIGALYGPYETIFQSRVGIGGFDLSDANDKCFALDYNQTGRNAELCFYRPGRGACYIVGRDFNKNWKALYSQGAGGNGIGGFDLTDGADQAFALDYTSSGNMDHICLYRPGRGAFFIVGRDSAGSWKPVYKETPGGRGIGGFDLSDRADRAFAFDYSGNGKMDHICLYRPGRGAFFIIARGANGSWKAVYAQGAGGNGIAGYDLSDSGDTAFSYDYSNIGRQNYICLYRPGRGAFFIIARRWDGRWITVYAQRQGGSGIGTYDLTSSQDQAVALANRLFLYRPGRGAAFLLTNSGGSFTPIWAQKDGGSGIGGYDLSSGSDRALALNLNQTALASDCLVLYRPGTGIIFIFEKR